MQEFSATHATDAACSDLRRRLRNETRELHETVESKMDCWDLNTQDGLMKSLRTHATALSMLLPDLSGHPRYQQEASRLMLLAAEGLASANVPVSIKSLPARGLNGLGVAYVVLGSRLGARVLTKRLSLQSNPQNLPEACWLYFTDDNSRSLWNQLCDTLGKVQHDAEAHEIVYAALKSFTTFLEAAEITLGQTSAREFDHVTKH